MTSLIGLPVRSSQIKPTEGRLEVKTRPQVYHTQWWRERGLRAQEAAGIKRLSIAEQESLLREIGLHYSATSPDIALTMIANLQLSYNKFRLLRASMAEVHGCGAGVSGKEDEIVHCHPSPTVQCETHSNDEAKWRHCHGCYYISARSHQYRHILP